MNAEPIGIRELRQNASRYVDLAKQGHRVPVTQRGKLVAYLVPADSGGSALDRLIARGAVKPAEGDLRDLLTPQPRPADARPLGEVLAEMRDEERW